MTPLAMTPRPGEAAVVVGGCGGVGWALRQALHGLDVAVTVLDLPQALEARGLREGAGAERLDLRDDASVAAAFDRLTARGAAFQHLVLGAGFTTDLARVEAFDPVVFDEVAAGNLKGHVRAAQKGLAAIRAAGGGTITAISTAIGQIGAPGYFAYAAAKAGLNVLVRTLANEAAPDVRVNAIAPGAIDTAFLRGGYARGGREDGPPARISPEAYARMVPLGRMATVEDVVGPLLFLMSPAARYVTGQVLHVNGGAYLRD